MKNSKQHISVSSAKYMNDYVLRIVFNDNTSKDVDFGTFLNRLIPRSICEKYLDLDNFKNFQVEDGNIVWGKNWDLVFPEKQLYYGEIL